LEVESSDSMAVDKKNIQHKEGIPQLTTSDPTSNIQEEDILMGTPGYNRLRLSSFAISESSPHVDSAASYNRSQPRL
jgi:hypothetical protein